MATHPTVEMYLNAAWTDVTSYVYYRDMIEIERGQSGEGARTDTSSCRMTLDNRDGRWSPRNPTGPYFGQLTRNVPLRVSIDAGESYLRLPGSAGARATTPDNAALDITGDIDIRVELELDSWFDSGATHGILAKYNTVGDQRSWLIYLTGNNQIAFRWSDDGTLAGNTEVTSDEFHLPLFRRKAFRVTLDANDGAGGNVVTFYTSDSIDGTWTELSSETGVGTTSIFSSTAIVELGELSSLSSDTPTGKIHKVEIRSSIGGTQVANPDFTAQTPGATSFADAAGRTWTIVSAATIANRKTRFVGEVSSLTIDSDKSGRDATVKLEAAGIMRRLGQGESPIDSALRRFIKVNNPIECWPLTDGLSSTRGKSLVGGSDMNTVLNNGKIRPEWGVSAFAPGIEPVISLRKETSGEIFGSVPNSTSAASKWSVDYFFASAAQGDFGTIEIRDRGAGTDADNLVYFQINGDEGADSVSLFRFSQGDTSSSFAMLTSVSDPGIFDGAMHHIRFTVDPGATDTTWSLHIDGVQEATGTLSSIVVKAVNNISFNWSLVTSGSIQKADMYLGYITYWDGDGPTAAEMWEAAGGFTGELAGNRLSRLTTEEDIAYQRIGEATTPQMGIQVQDQLMDILRDCETSDMGFLYEPREVLALAYRDQQSLYNQSARLTLDYDAHELAEALLPIEDDQTIRNDITAKQTYGSAYRVTKDSGTLSTLDPPSGVGRYDESVTTNLYDADDLPSFANWRLHTGTVDEARYPQISLNLRHSTFTSSASMMEDALRLDLGDKVVIENPPSWVPPDDIELLAVGFTETLGVKEREIVVNCIPASPYDVAVSDDATARADTGGTTLTDSLNSSATSVSVTTTSGSAIWVDSATYASDFPFDVRVGGEVMTVTACTPAIIDDFSANQTDSWGSADVGGTWNLAGGTVGGDYDVAGGVGTHTLTSTNVSRRSYLTAPSGTFDVYCDIAASALATGASLSGSIMARYVDADNVYLARLEFTTANAVVLSVRERVGGVETQLGTFTTRLTHVAGTYYRVRFQGHGSALKAKVWMTTHIEPTPWHISVTDTSLSAAGSVGCRSIAFSGNTNVNPVVSFDNFKLVNPQTFTVTRSVNGVAKSHSSGAALSLAQPIYVAR